MDCFARGLRNAAKIVQDGLFDKHIKVYLLFTIKSCLVAFFVLSQSAVGYR